MSADSDEKRPRRRPLSRSRKLGSRRRRGRGKEEEEEEESEESTESSDAEGDEDADEASSPSDDTDQTLPVTKIPPPAGSGTPKLDAIPAPPAAERWAKFRGAARRFSTDFSDYLRGLGQTAARSGVDFNQKVVKPFSHALFEAAICVALIFITGVFGVMFGNYLKTVASSRSDTVSYQNRTVRPGQKIDESFFSQGFDTAELHKRASRVLDDHLKALSRSEFVEAYALLSPAWKEQLSYRTFESGYLATKVVAFEIGKVETLEPRRIRLRADLKVQEKGQEKLYSAVYIAVLTSDGWRLDGGTFR
jgi:hypothetical protein